MGRRLGSFGLGMGELLAEKGAGGTCLVELAGQGGCSFHLAQLCSGAFSVLEEVGGGRVMPKGLETWQ